MTMTMTTLRTAGGDAGPKIVLCFVAIQAAAAAVPAVQPTYVGSSAQQARSW
jgi:hypothetical protein